MRRFSTVSLIAAAALAAGALVLAPAASAQASTEPVTVSGDGVTFSDHLSQAIFGGARIVPGASTTRTIWVRNNTTEPGNLALALSDVTSSDPALRGALRLQASSASAVGPVRPFSAANPCISLVSGIVLPAGGSLRIDLELSLAGNLHGAASQGSVGAFTIPVVLTSTDVAAPDGCTAMPPVTPVDPPSGGPGPTGSTPPGTIGTIDLTGAADGNVPLPTPDAGALAGLGGKGAVRSVDTIPNTGRFWQEYDIAGYLLAIALGCFLAWRWRRTEHHEEVYA
jgi:hypothetical protein